MTRRPSSTPLHSLIRTVQQPMSRDKSDTLLLLVACAMVLAPHTTHLPLYGTLTFSALLLWRGLITFSGMRMPPRWLLVPIAITCMAGVYATYRTFFGRDAGVAMLTLLLALKLLEMHAKRDLFVVTFLSFFLMLANFFYSQTIPTALLTIVTVLTMLTAQLSFQYTGEVPPLKHRLKLGIFILSLAAPLMLVLFILFPRIQGPLWGLPSDAKAARSGLSDTMAPGNITQLALSDEIAFRVKFIDPAPPKAKLYWRGVVLDSYDGRTWTQQARLYVNPPSVFNQKGAAIRHQVTLEPHGRHWLFALELPEAAPALERNPSRITPDRQMVSRLPINERVRYDVASYVEFELQPDESAITLRDSLRLPRGYNPQTSEFALTLRNQYADHAQLVNAVLQYFRTEKFSYTLEPPPLGQHAIDEFLFSTRAGFCEHYASAFVALMRASGVPARVVTGYQGGEINPVNGFMTVRQSDAHAWSEVWLQDRGWVRIDPTGAVAPDRIAINLTGALPRTNFGALDGMISLTVGKDSLIAKFRVNWDALTNSWNQWVLNYTPDNQKNFIRSLGFNDVDWQTLIALLFSVGAIVLGIVTLPLILNRQKRDPISTAYARLCASMAKQGYARACHEGPRDYCIRLTAADSTLSPNKKIAVERFLTLYEEVQYGTVGAVSNRTAITQLQSLLSECR